MTNTAAVTLPEVNVSAPAPISASTPQNFYAVRIINLMFNLTNGSIITATAIRRSCSTYFVQHQQARCPRR